MLRFKLFLIFQLTALCGSCANTPSAYVLAERENTIEGWNEYAKTPENRRIAAEKIALIKCEDAIRSGDPDALRRVLQDYSSEEYNVCAPALLRASSRLEELDWARAASAGTPEAYRAFLESHPRTKKRNQIREIIREKERPTTIQEFGEKIRNAGAVSVVVDDRNGSSVQRFVEHLFSTGGIKVVKNEATDRSDLPVLQIRLDSERVNWIQYSSANGETRYMPKSSWSGEVLLSCSGRSLAIPVFSSTEMGTSIRRGEGIKADVPPKPTIDRASNLMIYSGNFPDVILSIVDSSLDPARVAAKCDVKMLKELFGGITHPLHKLKVFLSKGLEPQWTELHEVPSKGLATYKFTLREDRFVQSAFVPRLQVFRCIFECDFHSESMDTPGGGSSFLQNPSLQNFINELARIRELSKDESVEREAVRTERVWLLNLLRVLETHRQRSDEDRAVESEFVLLCIALRQRPRDALKLTNAEWIKLIDAHAKPSR